MKNFYISFGKMLLFIILLQPTFLLSQANQYLHFDKVDDFVILNEAGQYVDGTNDIGST